LSEANTQSLPGLLAFRAGKRIRTPELSVLGGWVVAVVQGGTSYVCIVNVEKSPERIGHRMPRGTHPQGSSLAVSGADQVPIRVDVPDVRMASRRRVSGHGLNEGDNSGFHFLPRPHCQHPMA